MNQKELFKKVYETAQALDVEIFVVGGFVRDLLLGIKQQKDIDFVVVGSGLEFAKKFDEMLKQAGSLVEFAEFDTARYALPALEVEFAGARSEKYDSTSRKPKVATTTLIEDLSRRDFTINSMARQVLKSGLSVKIIDPFSGQKDLENKILRPPLDPNETFFEDPLRMLRAARFAAQLNFQIEPKTVEAMIRNRGRLKIISAERIKEELFKLLSTSIPSVGLWILFKTKLFEQFLPEIPQLEGVEDVYGYQHKDNLSHSFKVVDNIAIWSKKTILRFAGLVHDIAKPQTKKFIHNRGWTFDMHEHLGKKMAREIGRRLRMSNDEIEYAMKLIRWHLYPIAVMDEGVTDTPVRRLVVNLGDDLSDLLILCRADITTGNPNKKVQRLKNYDLLEKRIAAVIEKDKLRAFQSPVRGEEIMAVCDLKPGPTIGKIKDALEEAILEGVIPNEYEAVKAYFLKIKDDYLKVTEAWERMNGGVE